MMKTIFHRILTTTALCLAAVGILFPLFSCICCHKIYGNYPVYWLSCLILWWVMSFIHIGTSHSSDSL